MKLNPSDSSAYKAWNLRDKKKLRNVFDKLLLTSQLLALQYPTQRC